jgi:hypothetical protein
MNEAAKVVQHYGQEDLRERLQAALMAAELAGKRPANGLSAARPVSYARHGSDGRARGAANLGRNLREGRAGLVQAVLERP